MSRVRYANTPATVAQEALRRTHQVRIVTYAEEGSGVNTLPGGIYGFSYSPGLPNAPVFATRHYRSYEIHKLETGEVVIVGFAPPEVAARFESAAGETTVVIQPEPDDQASTLVVVPYARMRQHRQYAAPNQHGFTVTL